MGAHQQTTWSTILPPLRWEGPDSTIEAGQRTLSRFSGALFPLKKGNHLSFYEEVVTGRPGNIQRGNWDCHVNDQVEIVVPAGKSMTWEIVCLLDGRERLLLNYAENIGSYVRWAMKSESGITIRQLTGYARAPVTAAKPVEQKP
jgi:hypothetical protein